MRFIHRTLATTALLVVAASADQYSAATANTGCDVAIVGAGAAGANAAVWLTRKGYNVCVFEKESWVGGHCNTEYFTPPSDCQFAGCVNWVEVGVAVWENSSLLNSLGLGRYNLDTYQYLSSIVGAESIFSVNYGEAGPVSQYFWNYAKRVYGPNPQIDPNFVADFQKLAGLVASYPWLNTGGPYPDPLPRELLVDFQSWTVANNLTGLDYPVYSDFVSGGGMGSLDNFSALYGLLNLHLGVLSLLSQPTGLMLYGGCQTLYSAIHSQLGSKIHLNTQILLVKRPRSGQSGKTSIWTLENGSIKRYDVNRLVIAAPATLENTLFMDYDHSEYAVVRKTKVRHFYAAEVDVQGPVNNQTLPWTISDVAVNTARVSVPYVQRPNPYGPAIAVINTDFQIADIDDTWKAFLKRLPGDLVTSARVTVSRPHILQPYFDVKDLAQSPTPYTQFANLQGYRNTYYAGAMLSYAESLKVWESTYNLINAHF